MKSVIIVFGYLGFLSNRNNKKNNIDMAVTLIRKNKIIILVYNMRIFVFFISNK